MGFFKRDKDKNEKSIENNDADEKTPPEVEMTIESIRVGQRTDENNRVIIGNDTSAPVNPYEHVLILKEIKGNRYLPIWIGPSEADNITVKLQYVDVPRPLTHDYLCGIIDALGATVENIVISKLEKDCFYAITRLGCDGGLIEVDCRPSDAIAVAVRMMAPIYTTEEVLEKTAITAI